MEMQFLLNADESLPNGVTEDDIQRLRDDGFTVMLVKPSPVPQADPGHFVGEGQPVQREDGTYSQVWVQMPVPELPSPTPEEVTEERDRRMRGTFNYMGVSFDCDSSSLQRITGVATLAGFAIARGAVVGDLYWHGGDAPFIWISADNVPVEMDAQAAFRFGQVAAENETAHIFAARVLKDMEVIPWDYTDDKWWPKEPKD